MTGRSFTIYATASRISKGLLAIPRKYSGDFPVTKGNILVVFDDGSRVEAKLYLPYDPKVKECRIFGLSRWFSKRNVVPGDVITITVEDPAKPIYRIALDSYVRQRQEAEARRQLYSTESIEAATEQLRRLAQATRKRTHEVALQELARMAQTEIPQRKRSPVLHKGRGEAVPSSVRALLEALHLGRCQICSFAFKKRDGSSYFEIHHLDPDKGHHPTNLLVVCPNCHAQLEHANIIDMERVMGWLVAVTINGNRLSVRQPFVQRRAPIVASTIIALCLAVRLAGALKMV